MNFGFALELLKKGEKIVKPEWSKEGWFLVLMEDKERCQKWIALKRNTTDCGSIYKQWTSYKTDILDDDWMILNILDK